MLAVSTIWYWTVDGISLIALLLAFTGILDTTTTTTTIIGGSLRLIFLRGRGHGGEDPSSTSGAVAWATQEASDLQLHPHPPLRPVLRADPVHGDDLVPGSRRLHLRPRGLVVDGLDDDGGAVRPALRGCWNVTR